MRTSLAMASAKPAPAAAPCKGQGEGRSGEAESGWVNGRQGGKCCSPTIHRKPTCQPTRCPRHQPIAPHLHGAHDGLRQRSHALNQAAEKLLGAHVSVVPGLPPDALVSRLHSVGQQVS